MENPERAAVLFELNDSLNKKPSFYISEPEYSQKDKPRRYPWLYYFGPYSWVGYMGATIVLIIAIATVIGIVFPIALPFIGGSLLLKSILGAGCAIAATLFSYSNIKEFISQWTYKSLTKTKDARYLYKGKFYIQASKDINNEAQKKVTLARDKIEKIDETYKLLMPSYFSSQEIETIKKAKNSLTSKGPLIKTDVENKKIKETIKKILSYSTTFDSEDKMNIKAILARINPKLKFLIKQKYPEKINKYEIYLKAEGIINESDSTSQEKSVCAKLLKIVFSPVSPELKKQLIKLYYKADSALFTATKMYEESRCVLRGKYVANENHAKEEKKTKDDIAFYEGQIPLLNSRLDDFRYKFSKFNIIMEPSNDIRLKRQEEYINNPEKQKIKKLKNFKYVDEKISDIIKKYRKIILAKKELKKMGYDLKKQIAKAEDKEKYGIYNILEDDYDSRNCTEQTAEKLHKKIIKLNEVKKNTLNKDIKDKIDDLIFYKEKKKNYAFFNEKKRISQLVGTWFDLKKIYKKAEPDNLITIKKMYNDIQKFEKLFETEKYTPYVKKYIIQADGKPAKIQQALKKATDEFTAYKQYIEKIEASLKKHTPKLRIRTLKEVGEKKYNLLEETVQILSKINEYFRIKDKYRDLLNSIDPEAASSSAVNNATPKTASFSPVDNSTLEAASSSPVDNATPKASSSS